MNAVLAMATLAALGVPTVRRPADADAHAADARLIARHQAGDRDAFNQIYRAHVDAVFRRLSRILGPVAEREDITQDVFLGLHRALPTFRGEARLSTLIHRIAINRAYEFLRRQARRPATPVDAAVFDDMVGPSTSPEASASTREELHRVFTLLGRIKPKKRIAFLLRTVDGLSFEEIGDLVDATPEAVAKRIQHAQRELDELLARSQQADRRSA